MIKRDKRNIKSIVKVNSVKNPFYGRIGKVVGFRGDYDKGIPFVEVFIYDIGKTTGSVFPFSGADLIKM